MLLAARLAVLTTDHLKQDLRLEATSFVTARARDHQLVMAQRTGLHLDHHYLEEPKAIDNLIEEILGRGMTDDKPMARQALIATKRRWMWISKRMPTRTRWKR